MRYIGIIANMIAKVPQLSYVNSIVVAEVLMRSAKHLLAGYLQGLDLTCVSAAIAHFLNCLLCPGTGPLSNPPPLALVAQGSGGNGGDATFRSGGGGGGGGKRQRHRFKHMQQQVTDISFFSIFHMPHVLKYGTHRTRAANCLRPTTPTRPLRTPSLPHRRFRPSRWTTGTP